MPLTILVVDDDLETSLAISDYLERCGYSVLAAADGLEALAVVETHHLHLIVTDIVMPRMNGYELVRRVRQHSAFHLLPIIFLTERNRTSERIQGYQSGADLYLPKPFELSELEAAIRNRLERTQMLQFEYHLSYFSGQRTPLQPPVVTTENPEFPLHLTQRELEVLGMLPHGLSNAEIGTKLHLSRRTVEKYVSSLLKKTATSNRSTLIRFAIKAGFLKSNF